MVVWMSAWQLARDHRQRHAGRHGVRGEGVAERVDAERALALGRRRTALDRVDDVLVGPRLAALRLTVAMTGEVARRLTEHQVVTVEAGHATA
jgi:hypothetical protein